MNPQTAGELIMQYGFAGFSLLLLAMLGWMVRQVLEVVRKNNEIIAEHTQVMREIDGRTVDLLKLNRDCHNKLIARPCIARHERTDT